MPHPVAYDLGVDSPRALFAYRDSVVDHQIEALMFFDVVHQSGSTGVLFGSDTIAISRFSLFVLFSRTSWPTLDLFKLICNILNVLVGYPPGTCLIWKPSVPGTSYWVCPEQFIAVGAFHISLYSFAMWPIPSHFRHLIPPAGVGLHDFRLRS